MMRHCYNEDDPLYGTTGKLGIKVCKRWHNFKIFMKDISYHEELEFSQIDRNENFSPSNCKWMTHSELMLNRRYTWGLCTKELARRTGYSAEYLHQLNGSRKGKQDILKPYIIEVIKTKKNSQYIYKPEAVDFLLKLRENKSKN